MGTINYRTSDYITLGINPYDPDDFKTDPDFMKEIKRNVKLYHTTIDSEIYDYISELYECDKWNAETELKKHNFYYYHVRIIPGYYEGLSIDIENNFGIAYDSFEDRQFAQKEITEIKQFLMDCAGCGFVACYPGWGTRYEDYDGTIKAIKKAVKTMREEVKATPTWRQYERDCT